MVQDKYSPGESLERIKLMMSYDMGKTLNENKQIVNEQNVDDYEYFETATKSIMKYPNQISKLNFGNPTANVKVASKAIKDSVEGMGTDFHGLDYILKTGFNNISNSMSIIKNYESIGGESLFDALNGEWFAGGKMDKIVSQVSKQLMEWCKTKSNVSICIPKSEDELKYGKI
jgi:hypothetical protein